MVAFCLQVKTQKGWPITVRVNGWEGLFSLAPFSSCIMQTLFVQTFLFCPKEFRGACSSGWPSSTCWSFLCSQGSSSWQSQASQLLWSDTSEGNPGSVLQGTCKLQPGLTQAVHQRLSCSSTLCRAAGWELQDRHSPPPHMARRSSEDSWSVHALFPRKGIKHALTKFTLPSFFPGVLTWESKGTWEVHSPNPLKSLQASPFCHQTLDLSKQSPGIKCVCAPGKMRKIMPTSEDCYKN